MLPLEYFVFQDSDMPQSRLCPIHIYASVVQWCNTGSLGVVQRPSLFQCQWNSQDKAPDTNRKEYNNKQLKRALITDVINEILEVSLPNEADASAVSLFRNFC